MSERKSSPPDLSLTLTRVFNAPRALVFDAWTKKEHLDRWSAPNGFTIPDYGADLRPGGAWHCLMIAPNGEKYPVNGVYLDVVPNELLVMTHGWVEDDGTRPHETIVTVRFADENGKTRVTFEQTNFKSIESRHGHEGGWTQCFDRLAEILPQLQTS